MQITIKKLKAQCKLQIIRINVLLTTAVIIDYIGRHIL